ncbi:TetR/AcrR family transcriptional regulator [Shewanella colwelliana]|uniref:TetR/AcrR family transcriptional regulator n=1 Tax=Shewanella colwelliana TaxID=23 RepID=UPI0022AF8B15|nr:TetR-like C-terminal domain-containing protein [Shewanella colwelliana]MCZ4338325.1 TetR-like C-terminal domain-containing protein [Shewanella colwelliana]
MARRKEHTHDEIRLMAVAAVINHLHQQDVNQLSLRQIATMIGYAPSTLVKVFGSYQLLLLAVSRQTLAQLLGQLRRADRSSPIETLDAMATIYSQFALQHPHAFRLVFTLKMTNDEALPTIHANLIGELFTLVESCLHQLFASASASDLAVMSRVLWGGIHGLTTLALDDKLFIEQVPLEMLLKNHVSGYLAGMGCHKEAACY